MTHIFIVNPYAGKLTFADDLRKKLAEIKGLNYFVFNTRCAGNETELVKEIQKIFENEKLRFYCCGGSGTMRNMLNGFEDLSKAEVAFFPCGLTNDYLKIFGEDAKKFRDIEALIDGDVVEFDYIKTNHGVALNTFSIGMDSAVMTKLEDYRALQVFGENVPYNLAILYAIFLQKLHVFEIDVDGKQFEGIGSELYWGNGSVMGGSLNFYPGVSPRDGEAKYRFIFDRSGMRAIPVFKGLLTADYNYLDKISEFGNGRKIKLRRKDGGTFIMNQDGELSKPYDYWEAEIVPKGLHFVVPKGVQIP